MTLLIETTARVTIVILLSLSCAALLRRRAAAVRHWTLAVGLVCAAAMPLLQIVTPAWGVPRTAVRTLVSTAAATVTIPPTLATVSDAVRSEAMAEHASHLPRIAGIVWLVGALWALGLLCAGLVRLTWIGARCEPLIDPQWTDLLGEIAAHLQLRRDVVLLQSTRDRLLVTSGVWRPKIILPVGATGWTVDRIRMVLCHELAHVRRGDAMLQLLAGVVRAIYWFNPLVWIACHWLRHESERACDDDVLSLGMNGSDYASELLDIARALRPVAWSPAPGMARPSSLQRRVRAMLNANIDRRPLSSARRVAIAAGALLAAMAVAGSGAAAQAVGSAFSGGFVDALNNAVPNVTLMLRNNATGERYTVRSDESGRFVFDALPDGDYQGEVSAVGFASIHPFFRIKDGESVQPSVIPLPLGTVEETITVKSAAGADSGGVQQLAPDRLAALRLKAQAMPLAPPFKTRDVRPLFPPIRADREGTVFLEAIIDTNGFVKGLQVMQPADVEFGRAAFDAVQEWQFEPTRLHGVPVDTSMHVTVRFLR
jgi:TonB family protein